MSFMHFEIGKRAEEFQAAGSGVLLQSKDEPPGAENWLASLLLLTTPTGPFSCPERVPTAVS